MQWLISPRDDLLWVLGSVGVAWGMFAAWSYELVTTTQLILIWVFVFHGPHFWGTISRTYADREQFGRRRELFTQSLFWYVVGPALVGLGLLLQFATGRRELIQLFFFLAAVWAFHHVNKQHFGFLALYRAKHKEFNKRDFLFHKYYLLTSLWMPALIMLGTHTNWLVEMPGVLSYATGSPAGLANVQSTQVFLRTWCTIVFWSAQILYGASLIWRIIRGKGINLPLLMLILSCVPLTWYVIMISLDSPIKNAHFVLVPVLTMYHNIQYHGLIWHYNRTKYARTRSEPETRKRFGLAVLCNRNFAVYYGFGAIFTLTTIGWEQYGIAAISNTGPSGTLFKAFFWGFAFHHYYLDSKIWHASEDAELRAILGFTSSKKKAKPVAATPDPVPVPLDNGSPVVEPPIGPAPTPAAAPDPQRQVGTKVADLPHERTG